MNEGKGRGSKRGNEALRVNFFLVICSVLVPKSSDFVHPFLALPASYFDGPVYFLDLHVAPQDSPGKS